MLVRNLILDKTTVPLLNKVLNVTSLRHRAISNNIIACRVPATNLLAFLFRAKLLLHK